jgi:TonB-linked SusC/RagA family outer membrane protein
MRNMNSKNLVLFFLLLMSLPLLAQRNFNVTGKVVSVTDGLGLPGVTVLIKGQKIATITDIEGTYSINIDIGKDVLVFSMIGFKEQEFSNIKSATLNVKLSESTEQLESVIVVGYGTQKKASSVGAISQAKGSDLIKLGSVMNVSSALTGVLPGVTSLTSSGEPGFQNTIYIRGRGSWGDNSPLILVDGVERSYNGVDMNEIETASVLKDASATAVYGVKGANGVILITTKRGKTGEAKISFNFNLGLKEPTYSFKQLSQVRARELYNEARINEGSWNDIYTPENIDYWRTGSDPYYHPEINWQDILMREVAISSQYNLNISGGSKNFRYFTSLGFVRDGDIYKTEKQPEYDPRFYYQRFNYRSNLDFDISKSATLSLNVAGDLGTRNKPIGLQGSNPLNGGGVSGFNTAFYTAPTYLFPVRYENGILGATPIARWDNPLYNLNYQGAATEKTSTLFTDFSYNQKLDALIKGLSGKAKVSYNTYVETQQIIEKDVLAIYQSSPDVEPIWLSDANPTNEWVDKPAVLGPKTLSDNSRDLYYELSLNYANSFGKHDVSGLALFNRRQYNPGNEFTFYEEAWVGRATYGYDRRYLLEYNVAYTGSEKFAEGLRFGFFPAYAAGWVPSEEIFFKEAKWLNFVDKLKLKYSYGEVGSDKGAPRFTYQVGYNSGNNVNFGDDRTYSYGPLYYEGEAANVNATWEHAVKKNLGIEIGLLNQFDISIDLYDEKRTNILTPTSAGTPVWIGADVSTANIGETKSHGFEVSLSWRKTINENFKYYITSSIDFQENRVIRRTDSKLTADYLREQGKPIDFNSGLLFSGLIQNWDDVYNNTSSAYENAARQPGDAIYADYNGDGIVNELDYVPADLNEIPAYTYRMNLGFSYKNFDITANFYGVFDVQRGIGPELSWEFYNRYVQAFPESLDRWSPETAATATRPRVGIDVLKHNRANSDLNIYDASYLRLKSFEIAYNIDGNFLKKFGATGGSLFVNGNNLYTWTDFDSRIDPEGGTNSYPITKRYNFGFRLQF